MATAKNYLNFITEQFSGAEGITTRPMMGEYVIYCRGKVMGLICDNCLYVKPVPSACALMPDARFAPPYEGAKPMLVVDNVDDGEFLAALANAMYEELPAPRTKKARPQ